jgi:hypothetical protein
MTFSFKKIRLQKFANTSEKTQIKKFIGINDIINLTRVLNVFVFYKKIFKHSGKICEIISIKGFSFD